MGHTRCVQGWLCVCVCVVGLLVPVCSTGRGCVHTWVRWQQGHAGSLGKHLWIRVGRHCCVSQEGLCVLQGRVAEHSPCAGLAACWQRWPLPWHLPHAATAGLRWLGHAEGMWGLSCLFQTSQGGGMGELTNFL